jgi:hypothetical protein
VRTFFRHAIVAAVSAAALTAPALAQTRDRAGDRPIYEGGLPNDGKGSKVDATIDLSSAYDSNLPTTQIGQVTSSAFYTDGVYTTFSPQLNASVNGEHVRLNLLASSNVRHYASLDQFLVMNHFVGANVIAQVSRQTSITFSPNVTYAPTYLNGLLSETTPAGTLVSPDANSVVDAQRSYTYSGTMGVTHNFTPRAALLFDTGYHYTDFIGHNAAYPDYRGYDGGGRFQYSLNRHTRLVLGYKYTHDQTLGLANTEDNSLEIGLDYDLPLSGTRKTTFSFNLGPTMATGYVAVDGDRDLRRQYRMRGDASVSYEFARTWTTRASYHRALGFIEGLAQPAYTGAYAASLDGSLNRRFGLSVSGAYSTGESALIGEPSPFKSYTGSSRLLIALGREWASYVQYVYYYYSFSEGFQLPVGVSRGLSRDSVRVGLTLWVPMRHR